jgi:hypothetical protein
VFCLSYMLQIFPLTCYSYLRFIFVSSFINLYSMCSFIDYYIINLFCSLTFCHMTSGFMSGFKDLLQSKIMRQG